MLEAVQETYHRLELGGSILHDSFRVISWVGGSHGLSLHAEYQMCRVSRVSMKHSNKDATIWAP